MKNIKQKVKTLRPTFWGKFFYYVIPIRRGVVIGNMRLVFGKVLSDPEIVKLAQCFYSHILKVFWENLALSWLPDKEILNRSKVIGADIVIEANKAGKGVILITGHFGNWEFTPIAGILHYQQFRNRFYILRKTLGAKWIEKILFNRFYKVGLNIIPKRHTLHRVLDALMDNHVVAFIMDQFAKPGRDGVEAEFFGRSVGTFRSLALIAESTDAPVIPCKCYRDQDGKHVMHFFKPVKLKKDPNPDKQVYLNTLLCNQIIERFVLEHPDQWLWMHKRWKSKKGRASVASPAVS